MINRLIRSSLWVRRTHTLPLPSLVSFLLLCFCVSSRFIQFLYYIFFCVSVGLPNSSSSIFYSYSGKYIPYYYNCGFQLDLQNCLFWFLRLSFPICSWSNILPLNSWGYPFSFQICVSLRLTSLASDATKKGIKRQK